MTKETNTTDPIAPIGPSPCVEATLTSSDLDDLFRDLSACAQVQHIAAKHTPDQRHADPTSLDLVQTRILLDQPTTYAVQIRYQFHGDLWIDTLSPRGDHYHLLRLRHT